MSSLSRLDPAIYWLPQDLVGRLISPALVVYLDHVRENLRRVIARLDGNRDRWRPHVKTTKIPEVYAELARAGLRRFKCATTREAEQLSRVLVAEGVEHADVLLAHPLVRPGLDLLAEIAETRKQVRFSVLCEDSGAVDMIPPALDIFVDINPGMNRTGLPLENKDAVVGVARGAGARFRGVHFYDGHLLDDDAERRRRRIFECYDALVALVRRLGRDGFGVGEIVTCGTPSFLHGMRYTRFEELDGTTHRISPGTVVFHDARSEDENRGFELTPAALVFTRVVSHPLDGIVTCDAGSKSIAAEAGDPCAFVVGHPQLEPLTPSEEHLPFRVLAGEPPKRGTGLWLVPRHVCPTVNLADEAILVENGTARVVAVSARGHDLLYTPDQ